MHYSKAIVISAVLGLCMATCAHADPMVGLIDTFEDGTTLEWTAGGGPLGGFPPSPPANVATGGPAGADDAYLELTALGSSGLSGSKLSAINRSQWAGNYITAGIDSITMDLNNFGPDDASIRLLFADPDGDGSPANIAITDAVFVPAGSDWMHVEFSTAVGNLVAVLGDAATALSNATEVRIFHNPDPTFPGPPVGPPAVNLTLGVDNIQAVPEPSCALLLAALLIAFGPMGRRRGRF